MNPDRAFIIAEIGKNFIRTEEDRPVDEYILNAKELIKLARDAGADAVKFQTHNVDDEQAEVPAVSPHFSGDRYRWVKRNTEATPRRFWEDVKHYCNEVGITFFSTPMSRGAARILQDVGVSMWKVGSGDMLDFVLLDYLASTGKHVIISTGMSTLDEVDKAVSFLKRRRVPLTLLHCVSKYPCPTEDLRLETIGFLQDRYTIPVGFSDHSIGHDSAVAAIGHGAVAIEKHFSTSRSWFGSDHKVSMLPDEFAEMVRQIRAAETARSRVHGGDGTLTGTKTLDEGEAVFRQFFRKTLVYGQDLKKNVKLEPSMVHALRPQGYLDGLGSERYEEVIGKRLKKDVRRLDPIREGDLG